jgi:hypothetical protein
MIELTSVVISKRFRCHILWIWRDLTEFYEMVIFVNSVPGYKLDGHWLRCFHINSNQTIVSNRKLTGVEIVTVDSPYMLLNTQYYGRRTGHRICPPTLFQYVLYDNS